MRRTPLVLLAVGTALVLAGAARGVSDTYGSTAFHPFTTSGTNTSCVRWVEPSGATTGNCDPINLIFPWRTAQQVRDRLRAKGWTTWGSGSTQYLHFTSTTWIAQHVQLFRGDGWARRYHVRLWQGPGPVTVAGVHHERGIFQHGIDRSWEASEAFVAGQLCAGGCSASPMPTQSSIQGNDGEWRGWANNAAATVIP